MALEFDWTEWNRRYAISIAAKHHVPECFDRCNIAHERITLERRIVRRLLRDMKRNGWIARHVRSGGDSDKVNGEKETLDAVFAVDESRIVFNYQRRYNRGVNIVLGNGVDVISDWSEGADDADGFGAIVQSVCDWTETLS